MASNQYFILMSSMNVFLMSSYTKRDGTVFPTLSILFIKRVFNFSMPCCPWSHAGCGQKSFKIAWRCHQLLTGFLAKGHLPQVSRQSRRSLMIRVIMMWSWGLCTDLLAFALQPQMWSLFSKWGWYDRTARQEGRRKEIRKGRNLRIM